MISGHVTAIELLWTLAGIAGMILTSFNLVNAIRDRHAVMRLQQNGVLQELTSTACKGEMARLVGHMLIAATGAWAMVYPNPGQGWPTTAFGWFVSLGLITLSAILVYLSLLAVHSRRRVAEMVTPKKG